MPKYKVKVGSHSSGGRTYKAGDIIDTHKDLIAAFPMKFELVPEAPAPKATKSAPAKEPETEFVARLSDPPAAPEEIKTAAVEHTPPPPPPSFKPPTTKPPKPVAPKKSGLRRH